MLHGVIDGINNVKDGDNISFSIPLGDDSVKISGKTSLDSEGNIVIKADSLNIGDLSIEDCTLTIDRKDTLSYGDAINIHVNGTRNVEVISGNGTKGQISSKVDDLTISLNNNQVTISNAPFGYNFDTYEINEDIDFTNDSTEETVDLADEVVSGQKPSESGSSGTNNVSRVSGGGGGGRKSIGQKIADKVSGKTEELTNEQKIQQFTAKDHSEYWKADYQNILDNTSSVNYDTLAQQLRSDVDYISKDFSKVKDQMNLWAGSASGAAKEAMNTILEKFQCTMDNINDSINPACSKIEVFKDKLEELKKGKEELTGADGNGGLDKELKDLTQDYEDKKTTYNNLQNSEPSKTRQVTGEDGKTRTENNPEHSTWETNLASAKSAYEEAEKKVVEKQEQVTAKEAELDALLTEVNDTYNMIQELVSNINSFKDYFGDGAKSNLLSSATDFANNYNKILEDMNNISFSSGSAYTDTSKATLADESFFEKICKAHAQDGWKIENGIVTMIVDGKTCTYNLKKHLFSNGDKNSQLQAYFYLPADIINTDDLSKLRNLNTYTYFTSSTNLYVNAIDGKDINTITMKIIKKDPLNSNYDTVTSITKAANTFANTDLNKCQNIIGGDSVYGAHSLKIAASTGNLYKTVYCIDNAAIVTGQNGKAGTKEQFNSLEELKGLDGKDIYFINASGDDNYATCADMSVQRGRAYVPVSGSGNISVEQVKNSFTYTGIELVAKTCPNARIHIVYQDQDTAKAYQRENFPVALDQLASQYPNVTNESKDWDKFASKKYKTHSEGNYIPHDLAAAESTTNPNTQRDKTYRA